MASNELMKLFGTSGPVAFVTGSGADRVGRAIARHLAEAGYTIVLHANHSVNEVTQVCEAWNAEGLRTSFVTGSVDQEANLARWCDEIKQRHGALHVLVNSAASWEPTPLRN